MLLSTSPRRAVRRVILCAGSALLIDAAIVSAQATQTQTTAPVVESGAPAPDLALMRDELHRLHDEVGALRAELASLRGAIDERRAGASAPALVPASYVRRDRKSVV